MSQKMWSSALTPPSVGSELAPLACAGGGEEAGGRSVGGLGGGTPGRVGRGGAVATAAPRLRAGASTN